jgi:hypothetical protein
MTGKEELNHSVATEEKWKLFALFGAPKLCKNVHFVRLVFCAQA